MRSLAGVKSNEEVYDPVSIVKEATAKNEVMVFSKSYCPYCEKTKDLFKANGIPFGVIELDQDRHGGEIQATLQDMTKQRTVPSVWIKNQHIGGCDDTLRLHSSGELKKLLSK